MNSYEALIDECSKDNIDVIEKRFKSKAKGLWKDHKIGISSNLATIAEKYCTLAEEYGHFKTTYGNILDLSNISNLKQEMRARNYAYEKLCSIQKILKAIEHGALNRYEIAESLDVTDDFLSNAIEYHKRKNGLLWKHGDFIVCFEPTIRIIKVDKNIIYLI